MYQKVTKSSEIGALKMHKNVAEEYIKNPDNYVRTFTVQINGKKRHIITYKADKNGAALRYLHIYMANLIPLCYESMPNSFAYKIGLGILPCLEQHLESDVFLKTDIHEFFNSIQYDLLLDLILEDTACKKNKALMKLILKTCFYDGHMPIGFVTSPALSDLYLHKLDKSFVNRANVVYSRYADDFIISGNGNEEIMKDIKNEIESVLSEYGLQLNEKKTYCRTLRQEGDAIHVLGLNLVKGERHNRITVSDRYIRSTSKDICELLTNHNYLTNEEKEYDLARLNGMIEFVRYASPSSFKKLEKMVSIKHGEKVELDHLKDFVKRKNS